nr:M3 family metallopeptidase [Candidatus Sigynarchaeota archaeon]
MTRPELPATVKPREYIDPSIRGNSWKPIKSALKRFMKEPISSPDDLITFIKKYTELYDAVETVTMLKSAAFFGKQDFISTMALLGQAIKVTLPAYLTRKKVFKFIHDKPAYDALPPEHAQLKRIIEKEVSEKTSMLPIAAEYLRVLSYTRKVGGLRVNFDGKKLSLPKLRAFFYDPDRAVRERAWKLYYQRLATQYAWCDKTFDKLLSNRSKQAKKAGFENARDYYHHKRGRFDFTPDDCFKFHDAVEASVLPLIKQLNAERSDVLHLDVLRPWDKLVDLDDRVLKPYSTPGELVEKMIRVYSKIKPSYGKTLQFMQDNGFIDHENRKGKVPGAMCEPLVDYQAGYITANTVGINEDVFTLAHEGGHGMHFAACASIPIAMYHEILSFPMEVAEVGSMAMEFLALDQVGEFYPDERDVLKAKRFLLEDATRLLPWCAIIDAFQQWIYTNPGHSAGERTNQFKALVDRFETASGTDYTGLDIEKGALWLKQTHVFQSPFYYIEYGIAQLAALGIYRNLRREGRSAIDKYDAFLHAGNSRPLPELYSLAGVKFDFSKEYIAELMDFVRQELKNTRT